MISSLDFLPFTFLFFWGNHQEAIQSVKTTIFSCQKITFERELASYCPVTKRVLLNKKINFLSKGHSTLDAVGSWQIILPMPNLERTY